MIIHEHNVLEYKNKNDESKGGGKGGGLANADRADEGGRGVGEMLTMADRGGLAPQFLADISCEQPPMAFVRSNSILDVCLFSFFFLH